MHAKTLIPVATAIIGFAVGWASHHAPEPIPVADHTTADVPPSPKTRSANTGPAGGTAFREHHGYSGIPKAGPGEEGSVDLANVNPAIMSTALSPVVERLAQAGSNRIAEALGLDDAQRQRLDEVLAQHKKNDDGPPPHTPGEMMDRKAKAAAALDGELNQILTPEQRAAYEAMKSRKVQNQIESRAQRELATLGDHIDMSPEQREAALQAIRANSAATTARLPLGASVFGDSQVSENAEQYVDMMAEAAADNPNLDLAADPLALDREMAKLQALQIEDKVARMASILTPAQLAQYRSTLEAGAAYLQAASPQLPKK